MTTKMRSLRNFRNPIGCLILLAALGAAAGCSTAETPNGSGTNMNHVLPSGDSVPGWLVVPSGGSHTSTATQDYIANGGASGCTECHGSDLSGGISGTSCFANTAGCHHDPVANWATPAVHGATAKKAPGSSGFASCQICHGNNFSGGGAQTPCSSCHVVSAPHPARPWRGSTLTHTDTNTSNAPVCAQCHFPGSPNNPANHPATPAPSGTAPGCFNSTLCHSEATVPHPVGSAWVATSPAAQPHGNDAKAPPGSTTGFTYCQVCHGTGTNFSGGSSNVSCYPCHSTTSNSPHASQWRTGDTYLHTTTAEGNAAVCAFCHLNGANSPIAPPSPPAPAGTAAGCFNSTLCHGAGGVPHPVGSTWVAASPAAQPHGVSAKATPGATAGFSYCQVCHGTGTNFSGGSSGVSCYPCHGNVGTPHPSQWASTDTYGHDNTATGNANVCAFCHRNTNPGTPGCFNNTLCHGAGGVPHPVGSTWVAASPAAQPHGVSAKATPGATAGYLYCQTCHGTGTNFSGGSSNVSCYPCHGPTSNSPHASQWRTGDTYLHTTTAEGNASACAFCHLNGANSPIAPPSPPAPAGTAAGCFNSTLCHGAGVHPANWAQVTQHGPAAKAAPSASGGFSYCKTCHGTGTTSPANFGGGTSGTSCYPCHTVNAPHPAGATWRGSNSPTHRTTNQGQANLDRCAECHRSTAGTAGCFNNTLCHN